MSKLLQDADLAPDSESLRPPHVVQSVVLFSAGYYVGGIVGLLLGFPPSNIGTIWPSTAVLLAALLLAPPRYWWMYLLAAVPTHLHLTVNFGPATPLAVMLSQVAGNIILALLAALGVRSVIGSPPRFDNLRDTIAFVHALQDFAHLTSRSESAFASNRKPIPPFVTSAASGWLISCAIEIWSESTF